ncbi:hypothetical protein EDD11_004287 [Mortierella claussenii]|nr:hypothetical protein EDD11_004287 [Mortierella claussenii]
MGGQPSKSSKILSRSTVDSSTPSHTEKGCTHRNYIDLRSTPVGTSCGSEGDSSQEAGRSNSQLTSEASIQNTSIQRAPDSRGSKSQNDDPSLNDLQEQKLQKKINRKHQKAEKQRRKQQQRQQPLPRPYQQSPTTSTPFTLASPLLDMTLSGGAASQGTVEGMQNNLASTASPPTALPSGLFTQQTQSSKLSFIRGKPGFAWLEKRLPTASLEASGDTTGASSEGEPLEEMEIEAAKGYIDRVTEQHYLMKDVMGGNYHAPLDLVFKRVLENGCGAGDWTLDMASEMPETDFVACPQIMFTTSNAGKNTAIPRPRGLLGADQSQQTSNPINIGQANTASTSTTSIGSTGSSGQQAGIRSALKPRNCSFHSEVPLNRLPFANESFDFVYQRRQCVVLMSTEWQRTMLELFRVVKRGGWVEILEPDLYLRGGGELCQLAGEYCVGIFEAMGRNPKVIHEMEHLLENAGFVNVSAKVFSIPLGWGGVIGQAMLVNQRLFVNELEPIYVRQGHGESQEYRDLTKNIFDEAVERKAYINYHVVFAQKPASTTDRLIHQQIKQQESQQL